MRSSAPVQAAHTREEHSNYGHDPVQAVQIYRLSYAFSLGLLLLTIFDAAIVGLTWREYTQTAGEER